MNIDKEIDEFLAAVIPAWCTMDFDTFSETIAWSAYDPLIANSWTKRILKMINDCREAGLKPKEIAEFFPTVSQTRLMLSLDSWMAKYADISREDREKIFEYYATILKSHCLEDPYSKSKNVIHSSEDINNFIDQTKPASADIAKILGRAASACYHLGYALYSDMNPALIYDNYGPYDISSKYGKGYIVAVKEFKNIRCKEIWPETTKLPGDFIQIVNVYEDVKMTMNAATHVVFKGNLIKGLKYYSLKINGQDYPIEKLDTISKSIGKTAISVFQKFQSLDFESKKEKYYFTKAYFYKELYKKLGQDWQPSKEILDEARGQELHYFNLPSGKKEQEEIVRSMLDPRVDPSTINL